MARDVILIVLSNKLYLSTEEILNSENLVRMKEDYDSGQKVDAKEINFFIKNFEEHCYVKIRMIKLLIIKVAVLVFDKEV